MNRQPVHLLQGLVLANEEVVDGKCERCGGEVVHKVKSQWMLKITEYAQKLIDDLDSVELLREDQDRPEELDAARSTGAEVGHFTTTRRRHADHLHHTPGHALWRDLHDNLSDTIKSGQTSSRTWTLCTSIKYGRRSELRPRPMNKDKTGVKLEGVSGINPVNGKENAIFISDYVLINSTPAVSSCTRGTTTGTRPKGIQPQSRGSEERRRKPSPTAYGIMVNSEFLDGLSVEDAKVKMRSSAKRQGPREVVAGTSGCSSARDLAGFPVVNSKCTSVLLKTSFH